MRDLVLYIATSIDGYIAKPDGGIDWLHNPSFEIPNEDYGYTDFYESIDATLMGNKTYQQVLGFDVPFPYPDKKNYVFSRNSELEEDENVKYIREDIATFTKNLKSKQGKNIWLVGGAQINSVLLQAGLIDKIILTLIPVTIGDGIPLFQKNDVETSFELVDTHSYTSGLVQLVYKLK